MEQDLDRNEQATPFKLEKAREKGQTARSLDAVSCAVFTAAIAYLAWQGKEVAHGVVLLCRNILSRAAQVGAAEGAWAVLLDAATTQVATLLLPFLLLLPAVAVLASLAQTGVVLSLTPLAADMNRLNPATGLQRLFSMRTLFDTGRALVKLIVLCLAAGLALHALLPQFHALWNLSSWQFLHVLLADTASLGWKLVAALLLVAAADLVYTRREFGARMRMSRRELKEEFRNREGDPRIRARQRELRNEQLRRSKAVQDTRTADVVITNPTHFAVALRYVHGEMDAPKVVAKGAGQLAAAMREIAGRHGVVVVPNPPLARRLFREAAIGGELPAGFHAEVARIIVWVLAMRRHRAAAAMGAAA